MNKVKVVKCPCGSEVCKDYHLRGIGKFVQGSGFTKEEAELIALLVNQGDFKDAYIGARENLLMWKKRALEAEKQSQQAQGEPVAAQHRFRHPQAAMPNWSRWLPADIDKKHPTWHVDLAGYEVEYRLLYTAPPTPAAVPEEKVGFLMFGSDGKERFISIDRTADNADELYGWEPIYRRSKATKAVPDHDLYEDGDADAPDVIKDRNVDIALGMCRRCGKAEADLATPCTLKQPGRPGHSSTAVDDQLKIEPNECNDEACHLDCLQRAEGERCSDCPEIQEHPNLEDKK